MLATADCKFEPIKLVGQRTIWRCSECGFVTTPLRGKPHRKCVLPIEQKIQPIKIAGIEYLTCKHRDPKPIATTTGTVAGCGCGATVVEFFQCRHFREPVLKQCAGWAAESNRDKLRAACPGYAGRTCRECPVPKEMQAAPIPKTLSPVHCLAFVTSYFNPQQSAARVKNLETFRQHVKAIGVPLFVVESSPGDSVLWQKERLLNRCIEQLPDAVDAVGWLDADVIFSRADIHEAILDALTRWPVIQPWSTCRLLAADGSRQEWKGRGEIRSIAAANNGRPGDGHPDRKHPGFAWAARRETLTAIGGLYDRHVTGSGDTSMALGFYGDFRSRFLSEDRMNDAMRTDWLTWARRAYEVVRGQVGFVEGQISHLYHGEMSDRKYQQRWEKLAEMKFDPARHVRVAANGSLEWTPDAPRELVEFVADYLLRQRKE